MRPLVLFLALLIGAAAYQSYRNDCPSIVYDWQLWFDCVMR